MSRPRDVRSDRACLGGFVLLGGCLWNGMALAQDNPSSTEAPPARIQRPTDEPVPIASNRPSNATGTSSIVSPNLLKASARLDGTPSPGLRVTLDGSASSGGRMWYRWLQIQGPKVAIEGSTRPEAHFNVPTDASNLGFVLVVGNASGVDASALMVEVVDPEAESSSQSLRADAGDEQATKVGRKVVLNGIRSEPRGKLRFRWIQTSGPKVALRASEGPTASFLPTAAGKYQFALVVASTDGKLSEASNVTVNVGGTLRASTDGPSMAIDELARISLASIDGGNNYADDLSKAFDGVADRIDNYKSFTDAIGEMTRRLDAVVPRDKERRAVWVDQMFSPLMNKLVAGMKVDGLDLTTTEAQAKPLTKGQKTRLAEQFRYTAAGLRSSKVVR